MEVGHCRARPLDNPGRKLDSEHRRETRVARSPRAIATPSARAAAGLPLMVMLAAAQRDGQALDLALNNWPGTSPVIGTESL